MEGKQVVNPYLPNWEYIPDGEPYVFNNRVYVYGSHDFFNGYAFCLGDYVTWSAPVNDLGDWTYEGVIFKRTDDPHNADNRGCLYAPDMTVGPDGRYYLFYALDNDCVISVAVSDTPNGKFEFYGNVHYEDGTVLGRKEGDEQQFDPGVITIGDTTYMYTGFCGQGVSNSVIMRGIVAIAGIASASVVPDTYAQTVKDIYAVEQENIPVSKLGEWLNEQHFNRLKKLLEKNGYEHILSKYQRNDIQDWYDGEISRRLQQLREHLGTNKEAFYRDELNTFRSTFHKPVIYATWNWSRTVEDALHHAGFKDFEEQAKALEAYRQMDF